MTISSVVRELVKSGMVKSLNVLQQGPFHFLSPPLPKVRVRLKSVYEPSGPSG